MEVTNSNIVERGPGIDGHHDFPEGDYPNISDLPVTSEAPPRSGGIPPYAGGTTNGQLEDTLIRLIDGNQGSAMRSTAHDNRPVDRVPDAEEMRTVGPRFNPFQRIASRLNGIFTVLSPFKPRAPPEQEGIQRALETRIDERSHGRQDAPAPETEPSFAFKPPPLILDDAQDNGSHGNGPYDPHGTMDGAPNGHSEPDPPMLTNQHVDSLVTYESFTENKRLKELLVDLSSKHAAANEALKYSKEKEQSASRRAATAERRIHLLEGLLLKGMVPDSSTDGPTPATQQGITTVGAAPPPTATPTPQQGTATPSPPQGIPPPRPPPGNPPAPKVRPATPQPSTPAIPVNNGTPGTSTNYYGPGGATPQPPPHSYGTTNYSVSMVPATMGPGPSTVPSLVPANTMGAGPSTASPMVHPQMVPFLGHYGHGTHDFTDAIQAFNEKKARDWLKHVELQAKNLAGIRKAPPPDGAQLIHLALLNLPTEVQLAHADLPQADVPDTWPKFRAWLEAYCETKVIPSAMWNRMQLMNGRVTQGSSSVGDYIKRFKRHIVKIGDCSEMDKIMWFMRGLHPDMIHDCSCQNDGKAWSTLDALLDHARAVGLRNATRKHLNGSYGLPKFDRQGFSQHSSRSRKHFRHENNHQRHDGNPLPHNAAAQHAKGTKGHGTWQTVNGNGKRPGPPTDKGTRFDGPSGTAGKKPWADLFEKPNDQCTRFAKVSHLTNAQVGTCMATGRCMYCYKMLPVQPGQHSEARHEKGQCPQFGKALPWPANMALHQPK